MVTKKKISRGNNKVRKTTIPSRKSSSDGHIYEVIRIDTDKLAINNNGDAKCTIYLRDKTDGTEIKRRGVARMWGNAGAVFIDSLEGHKNVQVAVSLHDVPAKLVCNSKTSGACWLADEYYWK